MEKSLFSQVVFNKDLFGIIKKHLDIPRYINMNGDPALWDEQYKKSVLRGIYDTKNGGLYARPIVLDEYVFVAFKTKTRQTRVKRVYIGPHGGYMLQVLAHGLRVQYPEFYFWVRNKNPSYRCNVCKKTAPESNNNCRCLP